MTEVFEAIDFLDEQADAWSTLFNLAAMTKRIAAIPDPVKRAERIEALCRMSFAEGAYTAVLGLTKNQQKGLN